MKLSAPVLATRSRYVAAFPLWSMPPGEEAEVRARNWTLGLIEQIVYEHPNAGYGSKRADPGRPLSKDALARQAGSTLLMWDMLLGAGSGSPQLVADPDSQDITGQVFVPVPGRNNLGTAQPAPTPPPPPVPPPAPTPDPVACPCQAELTALRATVEAAHADITALRALIAQLLVNMQPVTFPNYTGTLSLPFVGTRTVTLTPVPRG